MSALPAALTYARRGWGVLPLDGKLPRTAHGSHDATTDPDAIAEWWARWPSANIGLATGDAFDALDIDSFDALDELRRNLCPGEYLPSGPVVITGKGLHFYVRSTGAGNRAGVLPGVDWRGRGGYVVAPPSRHANGKRYRWARGPETPVKPPPAWLVRLVLPPPPPARSVDPGAFYGPMAGVDGLAATVARAPVGQRNSALNWAAYRLACDAAAGRVRDVPVALDQLHRAAVANGLSDREAEATIRSAMKGAGYG